MINLRPVLFIVGVLLTALGTFMLIPALVDAILENPAWLTFASAATITIFVGMGLYLANRMHAPEFSIKQAFIMAVLSWVALTAFAALPFYLSNELKASYTDAFFEAMSGITTTGATVFTDLDNLPIGINLWRGLLQWLGGLGIIVMAIAVLPMLQVGGMQLFRVEAFDTADKILPRATQISGSLVGIYFGLTIICFLFYILLGMPTFDAVMHSMTTVATGGFSNRDASFGFYSVPVQAVCVIFMILGSLPFLLYVRVFQGQTNALWRDTQVRWFFALLFVFVFLGWAAQANLIAVGGINEVWKSIFNIVSIMTGTGYATTDYSTWSKFSIVLFFMVMFIGGCAGSTSCGIKVFRFQVIYETIRQRTLTFVQPNRIVVSYFNGVPMPDTIPTAVMSFFFLFLASFMASASVLAILGLDPLTAISTSASALANVGPALGEIAGPAGNYAKLPDSAKWVLSFTMLLGRLELFTVLVLFMPTFWRT